MSDHLPVVLKASIPVNVGVEDIVQKNKWKGYFTEAHFNFKSTKTEQGLTVFVYDILGKTIRVKEVNNAKEFKLNLNELNQGVYFVKVISESKQETFKFFKQ